MENNILRRVFAGILLILTFSSSFAADLDLGPIYVERVMTTALTSGGHRPGNLEIKVEGGFTLPTSVICDTNYITTTKSDDPDSRMFATLIIAQLKHRPLYIRITDNPEHTAYAGRCSLVWVSLAN
jgi:hypothetical protein